MIPFKKLILGFFVCTYASAMLHAQTIAEKKAGAVSSRSDLNQDMQKFLLQVNSELKESQKELHRLYAEVGELYRQKAPEETYKILLDRINQVKENIQNLENSWREMATQAGEQEEYALWHQPDTSLGQLVMDYGSQSYVYLMTPEIAAMKLSVDSNIPIPRSSWSEMLEIILTQNGVGIKQLNPYLRQLYLINQDKSNLVIITNKREDLEVLPGDARIGFMLSPEPSDVKRIWVFLDKFINPNSTVLQTIGRDILIVSSVAEVQDLLKLYDFVASNRGDKEYKVISLRKVDAEEMAKILGAIFDQFIEPPQPLERERIPERPSRPERPDQRYARQPERPKPHETRRENIETNGLKIIALSHIAQSIFLIGTKEEIKKAIDIIHEVESQVGQAREKVIYSYQTKHSDPIELAAVLEKIYILMIKTRAEMAQREEEKRLQDIAANQTPPAPLPPPIPPSVALQQKQMGYIGQPYPPLNVFDDGYYLDDRHIVNPPPREIYDQFDPNEGRENFLVDPKTGAIVMVVEVDILPKLKELIKKLDVPKKMVQMEVLLFEKRINKQTNFGLNLLRIGSDASHTNREGLNFNDVTPESPLAGITTFFLSRTKSDSGLAAFDLIYKFLLSQDDVQINASPSVLAINQTPARIAIEEEISVNTGVFELPATGSIALKNAFARARYGIKIEITPTIHMNEDPMNEDDTENYINLVTDIVFETIQPGTNPNQPDVTRRIINNEVRIPDGQTVILGGLRRKITDDAKQAIPFFGELPGVGKLFSNTQLTDNSTEMFIFITPKIVAEPSEDLERIRCQEMIRRPGDIPSFLCMLEEAREMEKNRLLAGTMRILFGPEPDRCVAPFYEGEYDGRCE